METKTADLELALGDISNDMPNPSPQADTISTLMLNESGNSATLDSDKNVTQGDHVEKKKRGRPRKSEGSSQPPKVSRNPSRLGGVPDQGQLDLARNNAERTAAAGFAVHIIEQSGVAIAGDDALMNATEKVGMTGAFSKYMESKGIQDFPPSVALAMIVGGYYARALSAPPARPKVAMAWAWVKSKVKGLKNARFNRRNDGKRKDDTSEKDTENLQNQGN